MIVSRDEKNQILTFFLEELENNNKLIETYAHKPLEFLAKRGSYYPPKLAKMFMDIYTLQVTKAALIGPRGGGKTFFDGDISSCLFLFKNFDALIGSGSDAQSRMVYDRVMDVLGDDETAEYTPTMTTKVTRGKHGNWVEFVPASTRRVRGPHPGEGKRGGVLIIDEECEMEDKVFKALMGTGGTANPLIVIRGSTFHKIMGSFADLVDNLERNGYTLYQWDVFDVCKKCTHTCNTCVPEFREVYCKGKAKQNSILGWVSITYLIDMWDQMDKEWFEVELMGLRPSGAGLVIDPVYWKDALVDAVNFVPGTPNCAGIDWGFKGMAAAVATQMNDDKVDVFDRMSWSLKGIDIITADMITWRDMYGINEIYADSSHPFENDALRKEGFTVTEVPFVSFKEAGAGAIKGFFEKARILIPKRFEVKTGKKNDLVNQLKKWRTDKDGKIVKKDDHYCDALLCTMMKWWKKMRRKVGYLKITK